MMLLGSVGQKFKAQLGGLVLGCLHSCSMKSWLGSYEQRHGVGRGVGGGGWVGGGDLKWLSVGINRLP